MRREPYITLMASLPYIGLLSEKEPPINRVRLFDRLKMLTPEDRDELDLLNSILSWWQLDVREDDPTFVAHATRVISSLSSPTLRQLARDRLDIRTVMAGLRRRHAGEEAYTLAPDWGFGRYAEHIRANWALPDFGLTGTFPWIPAAKEKLENGDSAGLERLMLDASWKAGAKYEEDHQFDLEAVALYLMRWSAAERWSHYDAHVASRRFGELLEAALPKSPLLREAS